MPSGLVGAGLAFSRTARPAGPKAGAVAEILPRVTVTGRQRLGGKKQINACFRLPEGSRTGCAGVMVLVQLRTVQHLPRT